VSALTEVDRRTREAIDEAKDQLSHGWTPAEVLVVLADAAAVIDDLRVWVCDGCDQAFTGVPVQDPVAVSWIPGGAARFCSMGCMATYDEQRINAAGNGAS